MTAVPAVPPVTTPDDDPIAAIDVLLLDHVPPAGVLLNVPVAPWQPANAPVIASGSGFTVTTRDEKQVVGRV